MVRRLVIILVFTVGIAAQAQPDIDAYFSTSQSSLSARENGTAKVNAVITSVRSAGGTDLKILRKTFRLIQSGFLKKYSAHATFDELFTTGAYDCLTATALFSHVLSQMGFSYEIIETNYHIFLVVATPEGRVMLETTDRYDGFVVGETAIEARTASLRANQRPPRAAGNVYTYAFNTFQPISSKKLTGLLYLNQAAAAYNQREWLQSAILLEKANSFYASERIEELGAIVLQTVLQAQLDDATRSECLAHLAQFWLKRSELFAAN